MQSFFNVGLECAKCYDRLKITYELGNVMFDHTPLHLQRMSWPFYTNILLIFVIVFAYPIPKWHILLTISCFYILWDVQKQSTKLFVLLNDEVVPLATFGVDLLFAPNFDIIESFVCCHCCCPTSPKILACLS